MLCPKCGATPLEGASFCFICGERLPAYYAVPPETNPPLRRGPKHPGLWFLFSVSMCVLISLLIFGGSLVFISSFIGQVNGVFLVNPTSTTALQQRGEQVYKQVTSQNPLYSESLQTHVTAGWRTGTLGPDSCVIKNDGLHIYLARTNRYVYCNSGHGKLNDFALQVDMKILYGATGASGGMVIRANGDKRGFYYFSIAADGNYSIRLQQNNAWGKFLDVGTSSSFIKGYEVTNTLMVIAQGSTLYFYVNQQFLTSIQDSTYTMGYVGLKMSSTTSVAEAVYTNARIWLL